MVDDADLPAIPFLLAVAFGSNAGSAAALLTAALASTLAGNLTVVGSVANLIVLELAGERGRIGFWQFLRHGAAVTAATLAAALLLLLGEHRLGLPG